MRRVSGRLSLGIGLGILLLAVFATGARLFERLELQGQSLRFAWRGARTSATKVVLVAIDDRSRAAWAEPTAFWTGRYARILRSARWAGARWVSFDIIQASDADGFLESLGGAALLAKAGSPDAAFAEALADEAGHVGLAYKHAPDGRILLPNELFLLADPDGRIAGDLGFTELVVARDETVREAGLYRRDGSMAKAGFAAVPAARARGLDPTSMSDLDRLSPGLAPGDGTFLINYLGRPVPRVSAAALVEGRLTRTEAASLRGAFVIVGATHKGSSDVVQGPDGAFLPGSEMHLNALATLLDRRVLRRPGAGIEAGLAFALGALGLLMAHRARPLMAAAGLIALVGGYVLVSADQFGRADLVLPLVGPPLGAIVAPLGLMAARAAEERAERGRVESAFGTQVGRRLRDYMLGPRGREGADGAQMEATVLFMDLRGSSAMARTQRPPETIAALNVFFDGVVPEIEARGGIVYAFLGDGLLAAFGAPIPSSDHAGAALAAAKAAVGAIERLNESRAVAGLPALAMGCGVHTGPLIVGHLGAADRRQLTVVGDTVNTAARLESACKTLDARIVASDRTLSTQRDREGWEGPFEIEPPGTGAIAVWRRP